MVKNVLARRAGFSMIFASVLACTSCTLSGNGAKVTATVTRTVSSTSPATSGSSTSTSRGASASSPPSTSVAPKAPASWADSFSTVSTGVVRIDNICNTETTSTASTGTGFLIAPNLVATVAHVVEGDGALRVTSPTSGLVSPARVIGYDPVDDLALVQTVTQLPGHVFTLAGRAPDIGTEMAAIGFPLGRSMQLSIGHITGTHDHRTVSGVFDLSDVLLSDAALNPGNSGGPWITRSGSVIALDESGPPFDAQVNAPAQGNNGGVSIIDASTRFSDWRRTPEPQANRGCQPVTAVDAAVETLELYFADINESDYASAYAQLWSDTNPISGLSTFVEGVQSSTDTANDGSNADFSAVNEGQQDGRTYVDVTFRSKQNARYGINGETCTDWTLRYTFRDNSGVQMIDSSEPTPGTSGHQSC